MELNSVQGPLTPNGVTNVESLSVILSDTHNSNILMVTFVRAPTKSSELIRTTL